MYVEKIFFSFLIITFLLGIYVYAVYQPIDEGMTPSPTDNSPCPNLLIQKGTTLLLYHTDQPEIDGVNPIPFYNLDEYIHYLEIQRKNGNTCPILYLQQENNTQGQDVYRIRPSPINPEPGLPSVSNITSSPSSAIMPSSPPIPISIQHDLSLYQPIPPNQPTNYIKAEYVDANRLDPPYNAGNYPGFDPTGLYNGQYTSIDQVHDSTGTMSALSDNPMDPNWGGVLYTQQSVDSGKYVDNNITVPHYFQPKTTYIPGMYDQTMPQNYV
jgi:hypothetical protein